jgi:hypothetical protein
MERSSAICVSIRSFSCSKPTMAALIIWGVRFVGMCDVLSLDSLYPAYTADSILHLAQSLNPSTDGIDCINVVTVASFEVPPSRSEKFQ